MDEPAALNGSALVQSLFQRVEDKAGMGGPADPPADDPSGEGVDDEGHVDEALPGRDVGEVRQPERVRARCVELPVHPVERADDGRVADGGADLAAAHDALQAHPPHQPGYRTTGNLFSGFAIE